MLNCQEKNIYPIFLSRIFSKYEQCLVEIGDIHYCLFYLPHSAKWKIILHNFKLMYNEREEIPRRFWKLNERDPKAKVTQSHKLHREIKSIRFDNLMEKAWQKRNILSEEITSFRLSWSLNMNTYWRYSFTV